MGKAPSAVHLEGWQEPAGIPSHRNVGRRAWLVPRSAEELLAVSACCVCALPAEQLHVIILYRTLGAFGMCFASEEVLLK